MRHRVAPMPAPLRLSALCALAGPAAAQNVFPAEGRVGIGTAAPARSVDDQTADPAVRLAFSDVRGLPCSGSTPWGWLQFVPDHRQRVSAALLLADRFGDAEADLFFQLLPAGATASTRWAMVEAWNGAGLYLGTGGTANPDRPIVFATGREEVVRFTGGNLGTRTPTERLTVRGRILAEELVLRPTVWPDFVFGPGYRLMPLPELAEREVAHRVEPARGE